MINVFTSYAPEDEKSKLELDKHLHALQYQGILENKYERMNLAGDEWKVNIDKFVRKSNVIILLLSTDYIVSDLINDHELPKIMAHHKNTNARIIPVLVNHCSIFEGNPLNGMEIYPENKRPVKDWGNRDKAWNEVIEIIVEEKAKSEGISKEEAIAKHNVGHKNHEIEVLEKYNLQTHEGQLEIGKKIESLGLRGPMGNYQMVNVNRETPIDNWWETFIEKRDRNDFFQFYFLTSCQTQMPPSFAERTIYELMDEMLGDDESEAIHFESDSNTGRVLIRDLPISRLGLKKTKEAFKKYFCQRFDFQTQDFDFDKFIEQGIPRLNYEYVATVFKIKSSRWKDFLGEFFQWIVSTFQDQHEDLPTFVFFFVIYIENAHEPEKLQESEKNIIQSLDQIAKSNSNTTLVENFQPVNVDDIETWFNDLGEENPDKIMDILNSMVVGLDKEKQHIYNEKKKLDMSTIELLQELVYKIVNK